MSLFDLTDKIAVVTGGAQGLGRAIVNGLAEAGANIVIGDINLDQAEKASAEIIKQGGESLAVAADVSRSEDADNLIQTAIRKFGRVDILVNNAGIAGSGKAVVDMDEDEWNKTLSVNLSSVFLCSKAAVREMKKQNQGKIINILSVASEKPLPHSGDYCASKGGALMLTKVLALELIRYNIRVNAICPGYFDTRLNEAHRDQMEAMVKKTVPIRRFGEAEEVKGLAVFLASSAGDYLVGAAIPIDGGASL